MLDDRKAAILRAVVEQYIETAQPVGSARVSRAPGVEVSSATVRNEMSVLEQEGFLAQPHTSAGRIPTEKGYRFFVDHMTRPGGKLGPAEVQQVRHFFEQRHGEIESMLSDTSRLLSGLTNTAAVVVGPPNEAARVRSVQLVKLAEKVALLVVVLSNGAIDKHTLEFDRAIGDERVAAASVRLASSLTGATLAELPAVPPTGDADADHILSVAMASMDQSDADHVYVDGASRIASSFEAVDTVREVLRILEQQLVVVSLLRDVLDRGLNVAIGSETGIEPLAECSLVVAPYEIDGEPIGTIGVLGPTRMNYPQALAAVAVVGKRLGNRLSETAGDG